MICNDIKGSPYISRLSKTASWHCTTQDTIWTCNLCCMLLVLKASAILDTDGDTFMKNECKADKWFIIELSQVPPLCCLFAN